MVAQHRIVFNRIPTAAPLLKVADPGAEVGQEPVGSGLLGEQYAHQTIQPQRLWLRSVVAKYRRGADTVASEVAQNGIDLPIALKSFEGQYFIGERKTDEGLGELRVVPGIFIEIKAVVELNEAGDVRIRNLVGGEEAIGGVSI